MTKWIIVKQRTSSGPIWCAYKVNWLTKMGIYLRHFLSPVDTWSWISAESSERGLRKYLSYTKEKLPVVIKEITP